MKRTKRKRTKRSASSHPKSRRIKGEYFADARELKVQIDREIRQRELDREIAAIDAEMTRPAPSPGPDSRTVLEMSHEYQTLWLANSYHEVGNNFGKLKLSGLSDEQRRPVNQ